ncbi:hypothetical protein PS689_00575 [Pseudomonas fluorescens]|nr:TIGR04255 family protein [Pseudomonas alliivorans]VVN73534.1 hypothetical protein PS689_00575 [Pseudomonas fluorescens]
MLKPFFEKHSIEAISLLCEFSGEVDRAGLDFVRGEAKLIQRRLPFRRIKRRAPAGAAAHELTASQPEVVGYMFLQKAHDEETENFEISGDRASFSSMAYSSFESFFADSLFYLTKANDAFAISGNRLKRVLLRYKDSFSSEFMDWEPYESLRLGSPYLLSPAIQKGEFWHFEAGFFAPVTAPDILLNNYKVEHNLSVSDSDTQDSSFILNIKLVHLFESPSFGSSTDFSETLRSTVELLRHQHKQIFYNILSDGLAERIGLTAPTQGE